jgi:hypothetical protein
LGAFFVFDPGRPARPAGYEVENASTGFWIPLLLDASSPIKRKHLIITTLQIEPNIGSLSNRLECPLGQQRLIRASDILAQLRCSIHLITLCQVWPDREDLTVADANATTCRMIRGKIRIAEELITSV